MKKSTDEIVFKLLERKLQRFWKRIDGVIFSGRTAFDLFQRVAWEREAVKDQWRNASAKERRRMRRMAGYKIPME